MKHICDFFCLEFNVEKKKTRKEKSRWCVSVEVCGHFRELALFLFISLMIFLFVLLVMMTYDLDNPVGLLLVWGNHISLEYIKASKSKTEQGNSEKMRDLQAWGYKLNLTFPNWTNIISSSMQIVWDPIFFSERFLINT